MRVVRVVRGVQLTFMRAGITESMVLAMTWKLYWSSWRSMCEPMKVNTGMMLCRTRS